MANTNRKEQTEISKDEIMNLLLREKAIEERNNRIYLTKIGKVLFGEDSSIQKKNREEIITPYLHAKNEWDERMGYSVARETMWRKFTYIITILFSISLFWNIRQSSQSHIEPYVIAMDKIGTITPLGIPHKIKIDQAATEAQMQIYITALRSFSIDKVVNDKNIDIITAMTSGDILSKASLVMRSQMPDAKPTSVVVTNLQPIPDSNSFQIDWTEIGNSSTDDEKDKTYWRAILVVKQATTPTDPVSVPDNPFGLMITELSVSPRVSQ